MKRGADVMVWMKKYFTDRYGFSYSNSQDASVSKLLSLVSDRTAVNLSGFHVFVLTHVTDSGETEREDLTSVIDVVKKMTTEANGAVKVQSGLKYILHLRS